MNQSKRLVTILLTSICMLSLVACAGHQVRGEPPFVQINGLNLQEQTLSLDLGVRNVNAEAIQIEHIEFSILLDEINLAVYDAASQANVIANGTENLRFNLVASEEGINLLKELEQGNRNSVEYTLEGVFESNEGARMKVLRKGHIYPVPGRPGLFR